MPFLAPLLIDLLALLSAGCGVFILLCVVDRIADLVRRVR